MWRIYTNQETLLNLAKEHNVHTICGPDLETYLCDPVFARIIGYLASDGTCNDFSAEFVPDSEYTTLCESYDFNPSLTGF